MIVTSEEYMARLRRGNIAAAEARAHILSIPDAIKVIEQQNRELDRWHEEFNRRCEETSRRVLAERERLKGKYSYNGFSNGEAATY